MTVLPLRGRAPRPRPAPPTHRDTDVMLTFDVSVGFNDASEIIDGIRRLVDGIGTTTVAVRPLAPNESTVSIQEASVRPPPASNDHAIRILPQARTAFVGSRAIDLTRIEFDLLLFLAEHPRHVYTRRQLLRSVWGHVHAGERTVDVHIRRLRAKLDVPLVKTVRGVGYRLADGAPIMTWGP